MTYTTHRRPTRPVRVGSLFIGSDHPVVVQSMIVERTRDVEASVAAIRRLHEAGCELVRVTTPTLKDAQAVGEIRRRLEADGLDVPLAADVHHQGSTIAVETTKHVDKVRINPGLFVHKRAAADRDYTREETAAELAEIERQLLPVLDACKAHGTALRIGVNHGSLSDRLMRTYGDTPEGMVESALEFVRLCEQHDFRELVLSLKAARVPIMVEANRLLARRMDVEGMAYPIHLGVTEAGDGEYARIKSTAGIATLLAEGIGDTIRVSLTEDPVNEIPVCYDILQALGLRKTKVEYIACPSCGRTQFDIAKVLAEVRDATRHLVGLDLAVMGCLVNGPGEMADADYGYVGSSPGVIALYRGRECVKSRVPQERGVEELIDLIRADGRWQSANQPDAFHT